jgi:pilin isopeptide linkage protein
MNPLRQKGKDPMKNSKRKGFGINLIAGALTLATVTIGSAAGAMAADVTYTFDKVYTASIPSGAEISDYQSPEETFSFTAGDAPAEGKTETATSATNTATLAALSQTSWNTDTTTVQELTALSEASQNEIKTAVPQTVSIGTAAYDAGGATAAGTKKTVNVTVSQDGYTKPGVYYYDFHEFGGNTAGVTYDGTTYRVAVTISKENGALAATGIKLVNKTSGAKGASVANAYGAGELTFTKTVAGNLGDADKEFQVTVTLTAPAEKSRTVRSTIGVTGQNAPQTGELTSIQPRDWSNGKVQKTFTVKGGTSITLKNIPETVKCLVKENDYSGDGYTTTYTYNGQTIADPTVDENLSQTMVGGQQMKVDITNTRDTTIDTGVFTTNMPYILILLAAIGGAVVFIVIARKRRA